jgi:hypothetical protein
MDYLHIARQRRVQALITQKIRRGDAAPRPAQADRSSKAAASRRLFAPKAVAA